VRCDRWLARFLGAVLVAPLALPACTSDARSETDGIIGVYAAAIVTLATADGAGDKAPVVFVTARADTKPVPLAVQVGVVSAVGDRATVRFVDDDHEAIDEDAPLRPVAEGTLLRLPPVPAIAPEVVLEVERYRNANDQQLVTLRVTEALGVWTATVTSSNPITGR
jgi:hypothetical protein